MTNPITAIERFGTGYAFTLDTPPSTGWDVWLDGARIQTRLDDTYYFYTSTSETPPPIEVIEAYNDTPSMSASTQIRLQWMHTGAQSYIVERSTDNITFTRLGYVYANGNIFHNFDAPTVEGTTYYRVYAAVQAGESYRATSLPLPCVVSQALIPTEPLVSISVVDGDAIISSADMFNDGKVNLI